MNCWILGVLVCLAACQPDEEIPDHLDEFGVDTSAFTLDEVQRRTFNYFWDWSDNPLAQTPDRAPNLTFSSIAATGFGLTSYMVGVERGFVSRDAAAARTLQCLQTLWRLPQGSDSVGVSGYRGFFYHFLTLDQGLRYKKVELSTIDTGLLMAGILSAQAYFNGGDSTEINIRALADSLYLRVEWDWAMQENGLMSMGWRPERGFIPSYWDGYNEAMILLLIAAGSPTHPIPASSWERWTEPYVWKSYYRQRHVNFSPMFGHQYSQMYVDFRGIQDAYMRRKGIDYFENSRRATYANRAYCIDNPLSFVGYDSLTWGLTACDGPGATTFQWQGRPLHMRGYWARGASAIHVRDDGTLSPTAVGGAVPFAPEVCLPTLAHLWETYYDELIGPYGYRDAFNLTYPKRLGGVSGWFDEDYLGIDQGPILIQIENYRTELIWSLMKKSPYLLAGLRKVGFEGGWLGVM